MLARLDALAASSRRPAVAAILKAVRARESFGLSLDVAASLVERLDYLDPAWAAQLLICVRRLPKKGSPAASTLTEALVASARQRTSYPRDAGSPESVSEWVTSWMRRSVGSDKHSTGELVVALIGDRGQPHFAEGLLIALEAQAGTDRRLYDESRFEVAVAELIAAGKTGKKRANASIALISYPERLRTRAIADGAAREAQLERLQARHSELVEAEREHAAQAALCAQRNAELMAELQHARVETEHIALEERQSGRNTEGRLRSRVLEVLELELEQIRGYLDRSEPNAQSALARLANLEALQTELETTR